MDMVNYLSLATTKDCLKKMNMVVPAKALKQELKVLLSKVSVLHSGTIGPPI